MALVHGVMIVAVVGLPDVVVMRFLAVGVAGGSHTTHFARNLLVADRAEHGGRHGASKRQQHGEQQQETDSNGFHGQRRFQGRAPGRDSP